MTKVFGSDFDISPPPEKIPSYAAGIRVKSRVYPYRVRARVQRHGSGTGNVLRVGSGTDSQNGVPAQPCPVGYASKRVFFKFIDFELYELYYASYLCRGIGQTSCSFEHVSCLLKVNH